MSLKTKNMLTCKKQLHSKHSTLQPPFSPLLQLLIFFPLKEGQVLELHVVRTQGQLLKQLVRYAILPSGQDEFFGATGVLEFNPGEREMVATLVAKRDGVPEVNTHITSVWSFYSGF